MDLRNDVHDQDPTSIDDVSFNLSVSHSNPPPPLANDKRPLDTTNDDMDTTPGSVVSPTTETVSHNITEGTAPSDVLDIAPVSDQNLPSDKPPVSIPPPAEYNDIDSTVEEAGNTTATPPTITSCDEKTENIDTDCDVLCSLLLTPQHPSECLANPEY